LSLLGVFKHEIEIYDLNRERAIEINKTFTYSYNNRGLAKIKIGKA
jgi:hypothetical protein